MAEAVTVWPSGLRRQTQVLVEQSAWVRTPQLSVFLVLVHLEENTPDRTRTGNLWIRSPTRYPLRHGGLLIRVFRTTLDDPYLWRKVIIARMRNVIHCPSSSVGRAQGS